MDTKADNGNELRRRAEDVFASRAAERESVPGAWGAEPAMRELEICKIELEIQGEALRQAKERAAEAAALYNDLYEFAPVGFLTLGRDGKILKANHFAAGLLGATGAKANGRQFAQFVAAAGQAGFEQFLERTFAGERGASCELMLENPGGDAGRVIHMAGDADAVEQSVSVVMMDITGRRDAEQALYESQARFEAIFNAAPDGILLADTDSRRLVIGNVAICRMLGYEAHEVKNLSVDDIHPERDLPYVLGEFMRVARGDMRVAANIPVKRKNGEIFLADISGARIDIGGKHYLAGIFRDITEKKRSSDVVWHLANFDVLTDLPNRALFFDRLSKGISQARRQSKRVALLFIDLDGFKPVNDVYGHEEGDAVLKEVANRWRASVREMDTVARLGGDEFAVIVGDLDTPEEAARVAEKLIRVLDAEIGLSGGRKCHVGASIGIGIYPDNAAEMDALLAAADSAMYEGKARGRNTWVYSEAKPSEHGDAASWCMLDESCLLGVGTIDEQHRHLVRMVNQINQAISDNASDADIGKQLSDLLNYTRMHFDTESRYMEKYAYPGRGAHDAEHVRLLETLRLMAGGEQGNELLTLQTIKSWLMGHIMSHDRTMGDFLRAAGAK